MIRDNLFCKNGGLGISLAVPESVCAGREPKSTESMIERRR
jgi:hypothetical protein